METNCASCSVLVVGGCGFVGYHLVNYFIAHHTFDSVTVISRSATNSKNKVDGAIYYNGDLTDYPSIERLVSDIKPTVIMHVASPSPVTGTTKEYTTVAVHGTKNLLKIAKASKDVRALIYTSSSLLHKGPEHINLLEHHPLANTDPKSPAYSRTKALAEIMILEANNPTFLVKEIDGKPSWEGHLTTGALRFPIVYGTHDLTAVPGALNALRTGQTNVVLGDGNNPWSFCSVENAANAHALLVQALLSAGTQTSSNTSKVDGEAFHINDGPPRGFWEFPRLVWKFAGHDSTNEHIRKMPVGFMLGLATFLEWLFWIFTLGTKRPFNLGRQQVEYACFEHTYSIEKAKMRLGYTPKQNFEEDLKKAVMWSIEQDGWGTKLKGR